MLAHAGQPPAPHDLWRAWNLDLALLLGLCFAVWAYRRGTARGRRRQAPGGRCFAAALVVVAVALVSPLDALSGALASAHMVQHVLLLLVAAPLLAVSSPVTTLLRGSRRRSCRMRAGGAGGCGSRRRNLRPLRNPAAVWALHVGTIWFWHAAVPYDAALEHDSSTSSSTPASSSPGVWFWQVVLGARRRRCPTAWASCSSSPPPCRACSSPPC